MNLYNFLNAISYASMGSVLIPIAFYFRKREHSITSKVLLALLLASLASDIANEIYVRSGMRGYIIYNLFFVVQISLIGLIYSQLLNSKKIVRSVVIAFWLFFILYTLFFQPINEYQSTIRLVGGLVALGFSVTLFFQMYRTLPVENILAYSPMWINMAVFFYFAFNFFLFIGTNYIFKNSSQEVGMVFWSFHAFNNIVKNCLFAVALYYGNEEDENRN